MAGGGEGTYFRLNVAAAAESDSAEMTMAAMDAVIAVNVNVNCIWGWWQRRQAVLVAGYVEGSVLEPE